VEQPGAPLLAGAAGAAGAGAAGAGAPPGLRRCKAIAKKMEGSETLCVCV
jgi:hypothetical protein